MEALSSSNRWDKTFEDGVSPLSVSGTPYLKPCKSRGSMRAPLKELWLMLKGVALVGDKRTGETIGAVTELNKLERLRHELTIALRQAEYEKNRAEYQSDKLKLELDGLRLQLLDLRQQYVTIRDEYSRGERKMTHADRMEQIPAGCVLGGPIAAYNQVIGDLYTILQK